MTCRRLQLRVLSFCALALTSAATGDDLKAVDVKKLAALKQGTGLIVLENAHLDGQTYRFEDFFWTGSGDGASDDEMYWSSEPPTTIYRTKTVVSTVYIEKPNSHQSNQSNTSTTPKCVFNCEGPQSPDGEINPTTTYSPTTTNKDEDGYFDADRQFWLLTVLKSDGKDPVLTDLKNSLAKLYKTAFQRQQERHLGINNRTKRDSQVKEKPVNVYIHDIAKTPSNGVENIEVLYHVSVSGKPVPAITAAADMNLVSDEEVVTELGYPFVIKAEPYLKEAQPQGLSKSKNTWIFIGTSIIVLLVLLLLIAFITLAFTKRKGHNAPSGLDNRRKVFDEEGSGYDNKGYLPSERKLQGRRDPRNESPTYINFRRQLSNQTLRSDRPSSSSTTSMSCSSLDISPLMGVRKQRPPPKKPPRPKAALNKTVPLNIHTHRVLVDSESSNSNNSTPDTVVTENFDPGVQSPKSYLSMPSVKSFPRGVMPEPLNKVLEPVSVLHLDMLDDGSQDHDAPDYFKRHGSVGAGEDPGVIGPIVWSMHRQHLQHGVSVDEGMEDLKMASNVSRMRKRFHDLLDDTFSLFGSRREISTTSDGRLGSVEVKGYAPSNKPNDEFHADLRPRPRTTDLRRVVTSPHSEPPRGAWMSYTPSPLVRPVSAGPVRRPVTAPTVNVAHVLAEGKLKPSDPAVPLIAAIKSELERCSLPGSTTDLRI